MTIIPTLCVNTVSTKRIPAHKKNSTNIKLMTIATGVGTALYLQTETIMNVVYIEAVSIVAFLAFK